MLVLFAVPFSAHDLARFPFCFPLLEDLSVVTSARTPIATDGPGPGTFVVLDNLTRLRISSSEADFSPVCALTTPVLRHLEIEKDIDYFYLGEEGVVLEEYLRFIRRSQAQLDTFSFTSQRPIDNILSLLLQGMPGLEKLYISGATFSSDTMNVLKNPDICPRLFSIINQGPLIDGDEGVWPLGAKDVLELMEARCKRINGAFSEEEDQDGRGRI